MKSGIVTGFHHQGAIITVAVAGVGCLTFDHRMFAHWLDGSGLTSPEELIGLTVVHWPDGTVSDAQPAPVRQELVLRCTGTHDTCLPCTDTFDFRDVTGKSYEWWTRTNDARLRKMPVLPCETGWYRVRATVIRTEGRSLLHNVRFVEELGFNYVEVNKDGKGDHR